MPRNPLVVGTVYTASITVNGQTTTWSFTAVSAPSNVVVPDDAVFEYR
jgi:hypothetical protein